MKNIDINFNIGKGLVPVVIQDYKRGDVLMLGFMNKEAFQRTLNLGWVYFWSRSRQRIWMKGEQSGNKLKVKNIFIDCDTDTLLIKVEGVGSGVCHTGFKTCFEKRMDI